MVNTVILLVLGWILGYYSGNKDFRQRFNAALKLVLSKKKPEVKEEPPTNKTT